MFHGLSSFAGLTHLWLTTARIIHSFARLTEAMKPTEGSTEDQNCDPFHKLPPKSKSGEDETWPSRPKTVNPFFLADETLRAAFLWFSIPRIRILFVTEAIPDLHWCWGKLPLSHFCCTCYISACAEGSLKFIPSSRPATIHLRKGCLRRKGWSLG